MSNTFQGEGVFPRCPRCGGHHRDVTPAFHGLVMEACAAVIPTSEALHRKFQTDQPGGSWAFDQETGLFTVSIPGQGRAHAEFQLVGTYIEDTGKFSWAWSWDGAADSDTLVAARHARDVGRHYWLRALTAPTVFVGATEAWHLAMVTAYLSDLPMVVAAPTGGITTYLALNHPIREN